MNVLTYLVWTCIFDSTGSMERQLYYIDLSNNLFLSLSLLLRYITNWLVKVEEVESRECDEWAVLDEIEAWRVMSQNLNNTDKRTR